jgi:hypothetical protein
LAATAHASSTNKPKNKIKILTSRHFLALRLTCEIAAHVRAVNLLPVSRSPYSISPANTEPPSPKPPSQTPTSSFTSPRDLRPKNQHRSMKPPSLPSTNQPNRTTSSHSIPSSYPNLSYSLLLLYSTQSGDESVRVLFTREVQIT